jgi:V/A-type H+-transporting ATPase subunit I
MIVPMFKYSFLIYHQDLDVFLKGLMEVGVLHVLNKGAVADDEAEKQWAEIREAQLVLSQFKKRKSDMHVADRLSQPMPILHDINQIERDLETAKHYRDTLITEIKLLEPWGDFQWKSLTELEKKSGIMVRFFEYPERQFNEEWGTDYPLEIINRTDGKVYFVVYQHGERAPLPLVPIAMPDKSLSRLKMNLENELEKIEKLDWLLETYAANYTDVLAENIKQAKDELNLHLSATATTKYADAKLLVLEGWCPETKQHALAEFAAKNNLAYLQQPANIDEQPPVLLKNNRFSKLFEPIGNLFSLPAYSELDLTVFFAPFFLLFFGFCLGDAGYGLVILVAASLLKLRVKGTNRSYLTLAQLFGGSTTLIGFFSGTLFGLEMVNVPAFSAIKNVFLSQDQLFNLALIIGFVQIIFGMVVQLYKQILFVGWLSALSRLGWIILLLSLVDVYILELIPIVTAISAWVGVGLIVLFGAPKRGWLKSMGFGLADLYNITGVMGDLLSYIRLFALGVSSAILGLVVNSIALSAQGIPYVGIVFTILILVVGHTANLMLASLSAFVHPMRLTFVEFYKNVGFVGGGKPYAPLARKNLKSKT